MTADRIQIHANYSISRIIKGGWHLAGGHGKISESQAIEDMKDFVEAGITTFDCADIYTGVESLIGKFLKKYKQAFNSGQLSPIQIHTKYVPDFDSLKTLKAADTTKIIERSLHRLGVETLDLVQFSWWDYKIPGYVETALQLAALQKEGKIRHIGVTNFDAAHLKEIIEAGVPIISNQVQYSLLDHRVEKHSNELMNKYGISYLCYGVLSGGFLSDRYLKAPDPQQPLENRSLTKYRLIIDEFGGYELFQSALKTLRAIADKYQVGIAEVATRYILQKKHVAAAIIGSRNTAHLAQLSKINSFQLNETDLQLLKNIVDKAEGPLGAFYELERDKSGKHGAIMKYNLSRNEYRELN